MRSHEERIEEVKRRIEKKRRQKKLRRNLAVAVSEIAACLVVIVGVSMSMPGIINRIESGNSAGFEMAAMMSGGSTVLGYIVVGLLAFVLGVCVTILCLRIRLLNKEEQEDEKKGDNADGTCQ